MSAYALAGSAFFPPLGCDGPSSSSTTTTSSFASATERRMTSSPCQHRRCDCNDGGRGPAGEATLPPREEAPPSPPPLTVRSAFVDYARLLRSSVAGTKKFDATTKTMADVERRRRRRGRSDERSNNNDGGDPSAPSPLYPRNGSSSLKSDGDDDDGDVDDSDCEDDASSRPFRRRSSSQRHHEEGAITFDLRINFNGRTYSATRTLPRFVQLRNDLIQELGGRCNSSNSISNNNNGVCNDGHGLRSKPRTSGRRCRRRNKEERGGAARRRNDGGDGDAALSLSEGQGDATPSSSIDDELLDACRLRCGDDGDDTEDGDARPSKTAAVVIPELPRRPDDTDGGDGPDGIARAEQGEGGFGFLHAVLVGYYLPAMERWLKAVADLVPPDSSPTWSTFLWEPLGSAYNCRGNGDDGDEDDNVFDGVGVGNRQSSSYGDDDVMEAEMELKEGEVVAPSDASEAASTREAAQNGEKSRRSVVVRRRRASLDPGTKKEKHQLVLPGKARKESFCTLDSIDENDAADETVDGVGHGGRHMG